VAEKGIRWAGDFCQRLARKNGGEEAGFMEGFVKLIRGGSDKCGARISSSFQVFATLTP